jgi:hypothetical protein
MGFISSFIRMYFVWSCFFMVEGHRLTNTFELQSGAEGRILIHKDEKRKTPPPQLGAGFLYVGHVHRLAG